MNPFFQQRQDQLRFLNDLWHKTPPVKRVELPEDLFVRCSACGESSPKADLEERLFVCPKCGNHLKITAEYRLKHLFDEGTAREICKGIRSNDPLAFPGYSEKIEKLRTELRLDDAAVSAVGKIGGIRAAAAALDSRFLMGSMGTAVGERITQTIEYATKNRLPLILFSASGGARMQEGIFSLMQMAKTSAALQRHHKAGLLYISCFTDPTTGGVTASFASLGDILISEPGALIGFAGPRVIEQTMKQKLPEGFQRAEFLLAHGFLDAIVDRREMRDTVMMLLKFHGKGAGCK